MTSDHQTRALAVTKKVFTRPPNLRLAWSTNKGIPSPFGTPARSTSSTSMHSASTSVISQDKLNHLPSTSHFHLGTQLPIHPYSSFTSQPHHACATLSLRRPLLSSNELHSLSMTSWNGVGAGSSNTVLKSGLLTWRNARDNGNRKGTLNGFEKALRRRQADKDLTASANDRRVYVVLEQTEATERHGHFETPSSMRAIASDPCLASPGACDPSAFDNDGLPSLVSPPVPVSLCDPNRWVPPSCWDVCDASSRDTDSHSKSSGSSVSDPLQTPSSSQPGSPTDHVTYLDIYSSNVAKNHSSSTLHGALQMRLLITRNSTVEIQCLPSESSSLNNVTQIRHKQLIISGIPKNMALPKLDSRPSMQSSGNSQTAVCILSSPNLTELNEWLCSIEEVIQQCRGMNRHRLGARHSSSSMLDTIRLLEQLKVQGDDAWRTEKDLHAAPMVVTRSLPSDGLEPSSASNCGGSAFSSSAFIDYYAAKPDSAATVAESETTSASDALYDFEDAYASIMQRFSDYDLPSPLDVLPSAPLEGMAGYARSSCLDVPISPGSSEFAEDDLNDQGETPSSPLDPWLGQRGTRSASSLSTYGKGAYADDIVNQIFAKGFRRRSSTLSCISAEK